MGRRERARWAGHDEVDHLLELDRPLTADEIQTLKTQYTGVGGLVSQKWNNGQFFTPPTVVRFVHDLLDLPTQQGYVLDLGCGAGAFFEGLDDSRCCGIEVDAKALKILTHCYPNAKTIRGDAQEEFLPGLPSPLDNSFDQVIGNPPYGLLSRYPIPAYKAGTKIRSEEIFWYLAYRACKPGGQITLILPDGVLSNTSSFPLRQWLMEHCYIRAVISLPRETFKPTGTECKTSVIYLEKFPAGQIGAPSEDYNIFMSVCEHIGWDSRCKPTGKDELPTILERFRGKWPDPLLIGEDSEQAPHTTGTSGSAPVEMTEPAEGELPASAPGMTQATPDLPSAEDLAAVTIVATPTGPAIAQPTQGQLRLF